MIDPCGKGGDKEPGLKRQMSGPRIVRSLPSMIS
jgi:hypothetical protein